MNSARRTDAGDVGICRTSDDNRLESPRHAKSALRACEAWASTGDARLHRFAFWLAILSCTAGVINAIATSIVFTRGSSFVLTPRTGAFLTWTFGVLPDSTPTFASALSAMGVGVGFTLTLFRFFLFREPELRRLDFIAALLQFQPLLWWTLRACMMMPLSASVLASVRETFASVTSFAFYMSSARPNSRAIFYVSCVALAVYAVGLIDRGIAVGLFGQVQFGVYFTPVIGPDYTGRYFAYLLVTELCRCIAIWLCAEQLGSDTRSRRLFFILGILEPLTGLSLQVLRVALYTKESTPGNVVFVTDVFTACSVVFGYTICTHIFLYARMHCVDSLSILERRVRELNSQAAVAEAVSAAQKEFTRYIFHEVRGPLNNIGLGVELLSGLPIVQEHAEMRDIVSLMGESTGIVRRITDDVLFIAKVESDQFNLIFSPFSVSAVLMSTVQQHQPPAAVKGVDITMAIEPGIPPLVLGDSSRIRQVLTNLASNAIKFVPDHLGKVRICIRATESRTALLGSKHRAREVRACGASPRSLEPDPVSSRTLASGLLIGSFEPGSLSRSTSGHAPSPSIQQRRSMVDSPPDLAHVTASGVARVARSCFQALGLARAPPVLLRNAAEASLRAVSIHPAQPLAEPEQLIPFDLPRSAVSPHVVDLPDGIAPTPTVTVVRFEVQDNGRGLSAEQCAQLFKPYAQISSGRDHGGTGLGLYISMRLAQQMGGRISVESECEGRGATFWFEVPLRALVPDPAATTIPSGEPITNPMMHNVTTQVASEMVGTDAMRATATADAYAALQPTVARAPLAPSTAHADADLALQSPVPLASPVPGPMRVPLLAPLHILIVDDVDSIRMLMRRLLKVQAPAAEVYDATDGERACEVLAEAKAAGAPLFSRGVVCMDKEMPRCDGFVASQRIRAMGFTGRIIGITGNAIAEDVAAFLERGADVVMTKPVSFPLFMDHLRAFARTLASAGSYGSGASGTAGGP